MIMAKRAEANGTSGKPGFRVVVILDGIDRHGAGCECGSCNRDGKSYTAGIYEYDERAMAASADGESWWQQSEVLERVSAPSEKAALYNARRAVRSQGWLEVSEDGCDLNAVRRFYTSDARDETVLLCSAHQASRKARVLTLHPVEESREREISVYAVETCCTDCAAPQVARMIRRLKGR